MSEETELTGYSLSRDWFDFCFENPEKIRPIHTAIYMFALEHWNRLGQKKKFGFPSQMTMDAIGVKSYDTYIPAFRDLIEWGFFDLIEKSKNQYSSNIIALLKNSKAHSKALDKAFRKHSVKQPESTYESTRSINKQGNKGTMNHEQENVDTPVDQLSETEVQSKEVAEYLLDSIIHYDPSHRYASNTPSINSWIKDIDRAIRLDGRTVEQLKFIIEYIYRANKKHSDFWAGNIESGKKLRKHFDKIKTQIQSERKNGRATKSEIDRNAELLGNTANSG